MSVQLNHHIVAVKDKHASAQFWADMLGMEVRGEFGPFVQVRTANQVDLDFAAASPEAEISPHHYAFLVSEDEFDATFAKIQQRGLTYWPEPHGDRVNEINHNDGGRGVYFRDPDGHFLEILTVPYGGWEN